MGNGGRFVTQQVADRLSNELHRLLGLPLPEPGENRRPWSLALAQKQLESAGFTVERSGQAESAMWFRDVGALAWYLKAVPWEVPTFSPAYYRQHLARLHEQIKSVGPLRVTAAHFWLEAVKSP